MLRRKRSWWKAWLKSRYLTCREVKQKGLCRVVCARESAASVAWISRPGLRVDLCSWETETAKDDEWEGRKARAEAVLAQQPQAAGSCAFSGVRHATRESQTWRGSAGRSKTAAAAGCPAAVSRAREPVRQHSCRAKIVKSLHADNKERVDPACLSPGPCPERRVDSMREAAHSSNGKTSLLTSQLAFVMSCPWLDAKPSSERLQGTGVLKLSGWTVRETAVNGSMS